MLYDRHTSTVERHLFRMLKEECDKEKFKFEYDYPEDFVKCFWQKTPKILPIWVVYRLFVFAYFFATLILIIILWREESHPWYKNLIYVGYWAYFTETIFFGSTFAITVARFAKEKKNPAVPPLEDMPWEYKAVWFLYSFIAPVTIANSIMFWFFVYDPKEHDNLAMSLVTGLSNSAFLILDLFVNAIPYRFLHFYVAILFPASYLLFTLIYQVSGGTGNNGLSVIYPILDWTKPSGALTTSGTCLLCVFVFHGGMSLVHLIKMWLRKTND